MTIGSNFSYDESTSTLTVTNIDVDGGTIDGTTIGDNTTATGAFTTLDCTSLDVVGDTDLQGHVNIGNALADNLTITARLNSDFVPNSDRSYDLGAAALGFKKLFLSDVSGIIDFGNGNVTLTPTGNTITLGGDNIVTFDLNNQIMTNVDINSGVIDNTTIGETTPSDASFNSLSVLANTTMTNTDTNTIPLSVTSIGSQLADIFQVNDSATNKFKIDKDGTATFAGDVTISGTLTASGGGGSIVNNIAGGTTDDILIQASTNNTTFLNKGSNNTVLAVDNVGALGYTTVTNAMLAGSIDNGKLTSSTISGVSLGSNLNDLTVDNSSLQLDSGTTYNASSGKTISVKALGVTNGMLAGSIDLTTKVTGILPIANGGTNSSTAPMVSLITATDVAASRTILGLGTEQNPTFTGLTLGTDGDEFTITESSDNITLNVAQQNATLTIAGNHGSPIDAVVFDMSDAGKATFNSNIVLGGNLTDTTISTESVSGNNQPGTNLTISAGQGTGSGAGGSIIFQTADGGASGASSNSLATVLTLLDDKSATFEDSVTVKGNLTVEGSTTTMATTNTVIKDNLIELSNGTTGHPSNDSGILINRGNQNNAFMGWDESEDKFVLGTTIVDANTSDSNIIVTTGILSINTLEAGGNIDVEGNIDMATGKKITWVDDNQSISGTDSGITIDSDETVINASTSLTTNAPTSIFTHTSNVDISVKSTHNNGEATITLISDDAQDAGDGFQFKSLNGTLTLSSDHNTSGNYDETILTITGNDNDDNKQTTVTGDFTVTGDLTVDGGDIIATNGGDSANIFASTTGKNNNRWWSG